jgi:CheY-like chemotaxis protein
MPRQQRVLSVGVDKELVSLRHAVLQSAGLTVFSTTDPQQAFARIQPADCGVMLLCYSMDAPIRERLAVRFRECCPEGRIISVSNQRVDTVFYGDVVFDALEGAEALIDVVCTQLAYPG